jgi:hypothetical protein
MSFAFRRKRFESSNLANIRRYFWYAVGEVLLIFAGISLALWFSNWNEDRQLQRLESKALADIAFNLDANVDHINTNLSEDALRIAACDRFLDAMSRKDPWQDSLEKDLYQCRWWTSPHLSSAAYESLKSRGTDLISDPELRYAIINLYEQDYAHLVNDTDKAFWNFQTAVMEPVFNRHVRKVEPDRFVPNDYEKLLDSEEFSNMLYMKLDYQMGSVSNLREILEATEKVKNLIETRLNIKAQ